MAFLQLAAAVLGSSALFEGEEADDGGLDLADGKQDGSGGGCAC